MATRDDILRALDGVIDPVSGRSIVHEDMIQGLVLRDGHVGFAVEVAPSRGASAEPLRRACQEAVEKLAGILSVTAVLTAHSEPQAAHSHKHDHGHGNKPRQTPPPAQGIEGVTSVIAVASGKGGVGKSTVAVNLALALAAKGLKVGLLDADIYGPSVPRLLDIKERPQGIDGKFVPIEKYGIKAISIGLFLEEDQATIWRGPMVQSALVQMINDGLWAPLDVLVIDMPPGTGDVQLTIAQRLPLKGAVIVSTPQDIALIDARRGIAMFHKTQVPILGIVENMSTYICPNCGHESHIFGHGGARETAKTLGEAFLGEIPLNTAIRLTSDGGKPIVAAAPDSPEARAFLLIADQVAAKLSKGERAQPKIVIE
ncbi:ATP-binding protein involved in chromosome partitioning [Rhizomicrobium palustre]|uniref:Iron-sulfur cluster carrier protein n=1 Tax=Rhizomicrobium palustre TaxID=189966 RepID=A0A846MWL5_9PROT|nr:iron-sulfur cluster carrier protein ApbC [Rhizomicrobium palustre]NIK87462.1 ATP-binding protein involved in chromosome partitioning [Rhizomicrobium palustre]